MRVFVLVLFLRGFVVSQKVHRLGNHVFVVNKILFLLVFFVSTICLGHLDQLGAFFALCLRGSIAGFLGGVLF